MLIDSTLLMYDGFQCGRWGFSHPAFTHHELTDQVQIFEMLVQTLDYVNDQQRLLINVPFDWVEHYKTWKAVIKPWARLTRADRLSVRNQKLFSLAYSGANELQRLWRIMWTEHSSPRARKAVGYALHIVPELLWTPEQFNREWYEFCFRNVTKYWSELSLEMRQAFCVVMDLTLGDAATLADSAQMHDESPSDI